MSDDPHGAPALAQALRTLVYSWSHGHVTHKPNRARCGGPGLCNRCRLEKALLDIAERVIAGGIIDIAEIRAFEELLAVATRNADDLARELGKTRAEAFALQVKALQELAPKLFGD